MELDLQPTSHHDAHISEAYNTGLQVHAQILMGMMQIQTQVIVCVQQVVLFSEPSPRLQTYILRPEPWVSLAWIFMDWD